MAKGEDKKIRIKDNLVVGELGRVTLPMKVRKDEDIVPGDILQKVTIGKVVRKERKEKG